ncbi:MAG: DUF5916 domain-containing protein [Candidatus Aminicenantes bacterium]|jgi:hypothetical protein
MNRKAVSFMICIFTVLFFSGVFRNSFGAEYFKTLIIQKNKAQNDRSSAPYSVSRVKGPINLDGQSDETAWEGIEPLPVIQQSPTFGKEPSERTEILLGYDDDYLYVAGRLYDSEPSKIQAPSRKRDDMIGSTEWFGVVIDSFNDNENGFGFFTTPTGSRLDVTVANDAQVFDPRFMPINISWNTFWDVEATVNEKGWFAEIRIPLSSLRFQDEGGRVVMGLIAWRWIARKVELIVYPSISPKFGQMSSWKPSQAQDVVLTGIRAKKPLYLTPYALGGYGQSYELNEGETAYERLDNPTFEAGLDVKFGLTNNLTLDLTVNTDFAQVEADDMQVNLTRFSLFFPEKRMFFLEQDSKFDFNLGGPNRLFYSRRIGLHEGESVRIYGGARLVGRIGLWDIGFLNMQTAPADDLSSENFGVLRVRRRVLNPFSYIGGIVTSRLGLDGSYNLAVGMDGILRLFGDDYFSFHWAHTFEDGQDTSTSKFYPSRLGFNWERRTLEGTGYNLSFSRSGEDFNPGIGFVMRTDNTRYGAKILHGWLPGEKSFLQSHNIFLDGFLFLRNTDTKIESAEFGPGWEFSAKSGWFGNFALRMYHEAVPEAFDLSDDVAVPEGEYTYFGLRGFFMTPMGKLLFSEGIVDVGSFYDGYRISLTLTPKWSVSSGLELSGLYQFNRIEFPERHKDFTAHIARLRVVVMPSTKISATAFIQYNSAINSITSNIRLRYNPHEGNDLYIVYNEGLNTNRLLEVPNLPFSSGRTILVKYSYTFNF